MCSRPSCASTLLPFPTPLLTASLGLLHGRRRVEEHVLCPLASFAGSCTYRALPWKSFLPCPAAECPLSPLTSVFLKTGKPWFQGGDSRVNCREKLQFESVFCGFVGRHKNILLNELHTSGAGGFVGFFFLSDFSLAEFSFPLGTSH